MAYRLTVATPIRKSLRRSLAHQIARARAELGASGDPAPRIHEARKCLKRARALLRLASSGLANGVAKDIERRIADVARGLSGHRDMHVLLATLGRLEVSVPALRKSDAAVVRRLVGRVLVEHDDAAVTAAMAAARDGLAEIAEAVAALDFAALSLDAVIDGLARTHASGRERLRETEAQPDDLQLHELRKVVQRHWRQMLLVRDAWPEMIGARIAEARLVSELLGTHNDIAVLIRHLGKGRTSGLPAAARTRTLAVCRTVQAAEAAEAIERARRLFADEPAAFAEAIGRNWRAARRLDRIEARRGPATAGAPARDRPPTPEPKE